MANAEAMKAEIIRCGKDPHYFINTYVRIQHPVRGLIPFKTFDYQDQMIQDYLDHRFNVILKARQLGISEVTASYAAWLMLFHRNKNILVMATKAETAKNIIKKVKMALKKLPPFLQLTEIVTDNRLSIELANGSQIKAIASSDDAGRSEALSLLIIDEAAFVKNLEDLWTGLIPTVTAGGNIIVLSTPNGVGNLFHKLYTDAITGDNEFHSNKLMWWVHPERIDGLEDDEGRPSPHEGVPFFKTSPWYRAEIKKTNMSERQIAQELECLRAGTRVLTVDGFKSVEDIVPGDRVLTHRGRFRPVVRTIQKETVRDELVKVSLPMSRKSPVYITKNHPSLKPDGSWRAFGEDVIGEATTRAMMPRLSDEVFGTFKQIDLSTLSCFKEFDDDFSGTLVRYHRQRNWTQRFINVDYDLGRLVGLYLAEGYKDRRVINFAFHRDEHDLIDFIVDRCKLYGMSCSVHPRDYSLCTVVSVSSRFLSEMIDVFVDGKGAHKKRLKDYIASKEFYRGVIDGTWEGDGFHRPDKKNVLRLANEPLIYQIRTLMTAFGLFTRVSYDGERSWYVELNNIDGRPIRECTTRGFFEKKQSRCKYADGQWWGRVKPMPADDIEEELDVYNLEVEEDNSYVCENLVVHNCNFNASGETFLSPEQIDDVEKGCATSAEITHEHWDRNLWIFWPPVVGKRYFISADVARGDGRDNSACCVWDTDTMQQCAEYYGRIPVEEYAKLLVDLGHRYNNALLVVENNNIGMACLEHIRLAQYENVYYSARGLDGPGEAVHSAWGPSNADRVIGFTMSQKLRPLVFSKLEEFIRNRIIKIRSRRFVAEARTFVWENSKPQAMKGWNDDIMSATAQGCWIRDTFIMPGEAAASIDKVLLENMRMFGHVNTEIKGASKDPVLAPTAQMGVFTSNNPIPTKIRLPGNRVVDFSWMYR